MSIFDAICSTACITDKSKLTKCSIYTNCHKSDTLQMKTPMWFKFGKVTILDCVFHPSKFDQSGQTRIFQYEKKRVIHWQYIIMMEHIKNEIPGISSSSFFSSSSSFFAFGLILTINLFVACILSNLLYRCSF